MGAGEYGAAGARGWYSRSAELLESIGDLRGAVRAYACRLGRSRPADPDLRQRADDAATGADILLPAAVVQHDPGVAGRGPPPGPRGSLNAAVQAFKQAESLLDEPKFRDSCRRERAVAVMWERWPGRWSRLARRPAPGEPTLVGAAAEATLRAPGRAVGAPPARSATDRGGPYQQFCRRARRRALPRGWPPCSTGMPEPHVDCWNRLKPMSGPIPPTGHWPSSPEPPSIC